MQFKIHTPEFVEFIIRRLNDAGCQVYIAGGAVRDAFLQRPFSDWDIATDAKPEEIRNEFPDVRHFSLKHGTVTLVKSGHNCEITTFRGKNPTINDDLACRDFTINAMAWDLEAGCIIDPYGGLYDIAKKTIRAVEKPSERFKEDPLRLLRSVRFAAELGFKIERSTKQTIINMAEKIHTVAPERIRNELVKILMSPKPSEGFYLLVRTGLLKHLVPELLEGYRRQQNNHHQYTIFRHIMKSLDLVERVPFLKLTALLHDIGKPRSRKKNQGRWTFYGHEKLSADMAREIMLRLKFSRDIIQKVSDLITHHMINYHSGWSDSAVRRLIRRTGRENIVHLLTLRRADIMAHGQYGQDSYLIEELEARIKDQLIKKTAIEQKDLAIDGNKVMEALGLSPGPQVGKILDKLLNEVIDNPEMNNEALLISMARKVIFI
ncbi:MAG: HD domain-containing protein [Deltaproteobacteria bacterium]|nr:HD domain-containing protein [Deltaproteobacteria bacterium]